MTRTTKRPYERPTLTPKDLFGAEALATACCRDAGCSNAVKTPLGKAKPNSTS